MTPLLDIRDLSSSVLLPDGTELPILAGVNLTLEHGKSYAILGKSGSGKTTLLSILGLLNSRFQGSYLLDDKEVRDLTDIQKSRLRNTKIGFVFQNYSLIPHLTARENVELPGVYRKKPRKENRDTSTEALTAVGLLNKLDAYPRQLSGGEQQRVALARALVMQPQVIFADEPTGALDSDTGTRVLDQLFSLVKDAGTTLVMVTHDPGVAARCEKTFWMHHGQILAQEPTSPPLEPPSPGNNVERIMKDEPC